MYIPKTRGERVSDAKDFFPDFYETLFESSANRAIIIAEELTISEQKSQPPLPL